MHSFLHLQVLAPVRYLFNFYTLILFFRAHTMSRDSEENLKIKFLNVLE